MPCQQLGNHNSNKSQSHGRLAVIGRHRSSYFPSFFSCPTTTTGKVIEHAKAFNPVVNQSSYIVVKIKKKKKKLQNWKTSRTILSPVFDSLFRWMSNGRQSGENIPMFCLIISGFLYFDFVRTIGRSCPFVPAEWAVQVLKRFRSGS